MPSYHETLSSLRFANQVSQCELGKAKKKIKEMSDSSIHSAIVAASVPLESDENDITIASTSTATTVVKAAPPTVNSQNKRPATRRSSVASTPLKKSKF